jgi:hypothetical protein
MTYVSLVCIYIVLHCLFFNTCREGVIMWAGKKKTHEHIASVINHGTLHHPMVLCLLIMGSGDFLATYGMLTIVHIQYIV